MSALLGHGGTGQPTYPKIKKPRCPAASSGCNGPKEGECMGLCTHRAFTPAPAEPVFVRSSSRQLAINTFQVYRLAGHSFGASLRQSLRALARNS